MKITTHVLDTSIGTPARGVAIRLQQQDANAWVDRGQGTTDADGRVPGLVDPNVTLAPGTYRLTFAAGAYFERRGIQSFYGDIAIDFIVRDGSAHYHVPLLVSPFGYSTYRGS